MTAPKEVTGANAGGPYRFSAWTLWAARIAQFVSWVMRFAAFCLVLLLGGCAVYKEPPAHFADVPGLTVAPVSTSVQPGDLISVPIPNGTNSFVSAVLDSQGWVDLPRVGKVYLLGMTDSEAEDALAHACLAKGMLPSVAQWPRRSLYYNINGEVRSPGRQLYLGRIRLSRAIESAGGATKAANLRRVRLERADGTIECYNLLRDPHSDPEVFPRDTVEVRKKKFFW